jgi:hypothetical protein
VAGALDVSLVLNGGVGGSGSTQYAQINSRIVASLPFSVSFWFRAGTNAGAAGVIAHWVNSNATLGNFRLGAGATRSMGPILTRQVISKGTTATESGISPSADLAVAVTSIVSGSTTQVGVEDAARFTVGEYVRLSGTFTGLTGITSGRDWRIESIAGGTLTLTLTSSGSWDSGQSATVNWSTYQPERWNLGVASFIDAPSGNTFFNRGGFVNQPVVYLNGGYTGLTNQRPANLFPDLNRFCVGAYAQEGSAAGYFRGEIAHVAVWEYFPTVGDCAELLTKAPTLVGWGAPLAYWPLLADETDSIGSNDLTLVGSPDITSDGPSIQLTSGGGGGSGYLPTVMRAQPINLFGF